MNKGYLYILYNESFKSYNNTVFKFGRSENPKNRISTYNTGFIHDCEYLYVSRQFNNCIEAERVLFFLMQKNHTCKNLTLEEKPQELKENNLSRCLFSSEL